MKRAEIITVLTQLKNDTSNIRGWCDAVDAKADAVLEGLASTATAEMHAEPQPEPQPERQGLVLCDCGEEATYKEGTSSKTGKPWAAYFCARRKDDPQNCGFKQWVD